jgi:hypothetical protein
MSAIEIDVPITKWSMLVWKNIKELPKENERVLIDIDGEVLGGRFVCGQFVSKSWDETESNVRMWASWPKAPKW